MIDSASFFLFLSASLILLITPGPAVLYIVARSVDQGRTAGLVSTVGIGIGTLFHVLTAAVGLSALLVTSAMAFNMVKYLGAAYLIYLGLQTLLTKTEARPPAISMPQDLRQIFWQGVIVNILNPKVALFFFAFLPQFITPTGGSVALQTFILGLIFVLLGILSDSVYALLAGSVGGWLNQNLQFLKAQRYFAGLVYLGLGVGTALSGGQQQK